MELWYIFIGGFSGIFRIQHLPDTGTPAASGMFLKEDYLLTWENSDGAGDGPSLRIRYAPAMMAEQIPLNGAKWT